MNKVICGIAISLDGITAGNGMTEEKPFGDMPTNLLHHWMFDEPDLHTKELAQLSSVAGAYIMGRNMFGPSGPEYDTTWEGWWGKEPPYHAPVFVLTHQEREPITLQGGTTFSFVTDGIHSALKQAQSAAGDKPIAIAGGAHTIDQFLAAHLIDELWLHIVPVTVGKGIRLFENTPNLRMEPIEVSGSKLVTHIKYQILR